MFLSPHLFRRRPLRALTGAAVIAAALAAALPTQAATVLGCPSEASTHSTPTVPVGALLRLLFTRLAASAKQRARGTAPGHRAAPRHGPSHGSTGRCLDRPAPAR